MLIYKVELLDPAWDDLDDISDYHLYAVGADSARKIFEE